jgi:F0F1-type ATP synthase delta subunit
MKNLLTVFTFAITMLLGVQTVSSQQLSEDKSRPEVIAKAESAKITEALDLNGDQSRAVFRAYVAKEVNYQKHIDGKDAGDANVKANKEKFDSSLKEIMKKTLTAEQYAQWLKMN